MAGSTTVNAASYSVDCSSEIQYISSSGWTVDSVGGYNDSVIDSGDKIDYQGQLYVTYARDMQFYVKFTGTKSFDATKPERGVLTAAGRMNWTKPLGNYTTSNATFVGSRYEIASAEYNTDIQQVDCTVIWSGETYCNFQVKVSGVNVPINQSAIIRIRVYCTYKIYDSVRDTSSFGGVILPDMTNSNATAAPTVTTSWATASYEYLDYIDPTWKWRVETKSLLDSINSHSSYCQNYLQTIANAVGTNSEAGDTIDDATSTFTSSSTQLMAQEDALNADADANVDAVNMDQLDLLGTYSQSMSFWMALVASLPAAVGSIWEVLVFGFLIAFLLFILRLVR